MDKNDNANENSDENKNCDETKKSHENVKNKTIDELNQSINGRTRLSSIHHSIEMLNENNSNEKCLKFERSKSLDPTGYVDFEQIKRRMPSVMSLGDWNATAALSENCHRNNNGKWFVDMLTNLV